MTTVQDEASDRIRAARPLAVVTGASTGIGFELARLFAGRGYDLVVTADEAAIGEASGTIMAEVPDADVLAVRADLRDPAQVERLAAEVAGTGRPIEALALNAGVAVHGDFAGPDTTLAEQLGLVDLNVRSVVHLAKLLIPPMVQQGSGKVLITSSIAGRMPGPLYATYSASKAFLENFAEGIRDELKNHGVTVTALLPGPTDTEFFERSGMAGTRIDASPKDDAAEVARDGIDALMSGKDHVVAGSTRNNLQAAAARVTPPRVAAQAQRKLTEPATTTSQD